MITTDIPQDLITAYTRTNYIVKQEDIQFAIRINKYSGKLNELHHQHCATSSVFITACNPYSELYTKEQNALRQNDLEHDLKSIECVIIPGLGQDSEKEWPGEPSFLAICISEKDAQRLGRKHKQNAVVFSEEDAVPRLLLLR
jgi:hypothetical protein